MATSEELQAAARKLFDEGRIDYFLGWVDEYGHAVAAIFAADSDLSRLSFDRRCYNNLAQILQELPGARVGLICKQCEVATVNVLGAENQLQRENIVVVGVGCPAMIDPRKLNADGSLPETDEPALWQEKCRRCAERNTPGADVFVGDRVNTPAPATGWPLIEEIEKKAREERLAWMKEQMRLCIRCYACRLACPLCFCHQCFVEDNKPQWLDKSVNAENNFHYHLIRALHLAGRCVECQECSRACPVGIPVDVFNQIITRDAAARYGGFAAGATPEQKAILIDFDRADKEDFIL